VPHIVAATADEGLRRPVIEPLAASGHALRAVSTWPALVRELASPGCGLALIDGRLPGLDTDLMLRLCASLDEPPQLRSVGSPAPPLRAAPARPDLLVRLARRTTRAVFASDERRELELLGLGPETMRRLSAMASAGAPVCVEGERGTCKVRIARALHRLGATPGPFRVATPGAPQPGARVDLAGPRGTVYLSNLESWPDGAVLRLERNAIDAGWRVTGGTRSRELRKASINHWTRLALPPLRERHQELRRLAQLYLERHRRRLGLPARRLDRAAWGMVLSHSWPGNARELENFVRALLADSPGATVRGKQLPPTVRRLLESAPDAALREQARSFEELVEARLRPIVLHYDLDSAGGLHRLAIDATERALIRLALGRTGGNQKAAAGLLGVARNTLRAKAQSLGLVGGR